MMTPTIHLNGSDRGQLQGDLLEARAQLTRALEALSCTCPNARDYYVQPRGAAGEAYTVAVREHEARMKAVRAVRDEIEAIWEAIDEQPAAAGRR